MLLLEHPYTVAWYPSFGEWDVYCTSVTIGEDGFFLLGPGERVGAELGPVVLKKVNVKVFRNCCGLSQEYLGVSQNKGAILRVPIIRTLIFWDLYLGPLYLGKPTSKILPCL